MKINEINELLYKQIERISQSDVKDENLQDEIERSKAMALLASQYIAGETLQMKKEVMQLSNNRGKIAGYIEG